MQLIDFHSHKSNEMIVPNEDGSYTVLINSRSACNKQLEAYNHALSHIENEDFEKSDIQEIEIITHTVRG